MPWLLSADGVNDHVTIPNPLTGNAGTDAYTVEFFGSIPTAPASNRLLLGVAAGTVSNGFAITPTGQLSVFAAGTSRYASAAGFIIFDTTRRKYRLEHDAGGAWRMYRDDALISSGTFSTSVAFAGLGLFFRINPTSLGFLRFDLGYFETTGLANSQRWDATLSGGSGSVLPTVSGTNQGTLVDFTVPDCWVFYSSGAVTVSLFGIMPKLSASASIDAAYVASFSGSLPKLAASAAITVDSSIASVSFSAALPKLSASVLLDVTRLVSVSGVMPRLAASITANVQQLPFVTFSGSMPSLRMSTSLIAVAPQPTGDPLSIKQALVNAQRAEENRNNEYVPPAVVVPEWWIIQQQALGLKQSEVNRARDLED